IEAHIDRAHIAARPLEERAVALRATHIDQAAQTRRIAGLGFKAPRTRLGILRKRREIRGHIGGLLTADLAADKARHDAPWLTDCAQNLHGVQTAAREIGTEGALAERAMAVLASMLRAFPIGLAVRGVADEIGSTTAAAWRPWCLRGECK